jgi:hypothetical protein
MTEDEALDIGTFNPTNPEDKWYVDADFFLNNYEVV